MSAAHARPGGEPSGRPWHAAKRAKLRRGGAFGAPVDCAETRVTPTAPEDVPQSPLELALAIMRDPSKPTALPASMAKLALSQSNGPSPRRSGFGRAGGRRAVTGSDRGAARRKLPPPFDVPDPYNSLAVPLRDALAQRAAATASAVSQPLLPPCAAGRVPCVSEAGGVLQARTPPGALRAPPSPEGEGEDEREFVGWAEPTGPREARPDDELREAHAEPRAHGADAPLRTLQCRDESETASADGRDTPAQLAEAQERARALEKRALAAEGRLREALHLARDMEQRALAAEALIAGARERW
jgi:hypothetical protein